MLPVSSSADNPGLTAQTKDGFSLIGDLLLAIGATLLGWFVLGLLTRHSFEDEAQLKREGRMVEFRERELVASNVLRVSCRMRFYSAVK